MTILTWIIGLAISFWTGAMGLGAVLRTESSRKWFGEILKQSPGMMVINGSGLLVIGLLVLCNLIFPQFIAVNILKWLLIAIALMQVSTLLMQLRGNAPRAAMAGPIVLLVLVIIYWFIRG